MFLGTDTISSLGSTSSIAILDGVPSFGTSFVSGSTSPLSSDSPPCRRGDRPSPLLGTWRVRPGVHSHLLPLRPVVPVIPDDDEPVLFDVSVLASSPRHVTRGESTFTAAKVDWLNATFEGAALSRNNVDISSDLLDSMRFVDFLDDLRSLFKFQIGAESGGGRHGFKECFHLLALLSDGSNVRIGSVSFGGETQRGRWLLEISGKGCGLVKDWPGMESFLTGLGARITRVDLAVDFLEGEYSVDDAMSLYQDGSFISRGRNPDLDIQGSWHEGGTKGRTLYIGKLKNGKTLCVYEKGKQLNMTDSNWTRYEVRLGSKDRVIPLDVLTNPDRYFVGSYPALAGMLEAAAEEIPTNKEELKCTFAHSLYHLSRCYGKYINQVKESTGCDSDDLVEALRVIGMPGRLDPALIESEIDWDDLKTEVMSLRKNQ